MIANTPVTAAQTEMPHGELCAQGSAAMVKDLTLFIMGRYTSAAKVAAITRLPQNHLAPVAVSALGATGSAALSEEKNFVYTIRIAKLTANIAKPMSPGG